MSPSDEETPTEDQQATLSAEEEKHLNRFTKKFFLHPPGEPWTPSTADVGRILRSLGGSLKYFEEHYPETPTALLEPILHYALLKDGIDVFACLKDEEGWAKVLAKTVSRIRRKYPQFPQETVPPSALRGLTETVRDYPRAYRAGEIAFVGLALRGYELGILALKREKELDHNGVPYRPGSLERPIQGSLAEEQEGFDSANARPLLGHPDKTLYGKTPPTPEGRLDRSPQAPRTLAAQPAEAPTIQDNLFHHPGLTAQESIVLIARYPYGENRTWPEVADKLAMTEITAKRYHARALTKLHRLLVAQVAAMRAGGGPVTPRSVAAKLGVDRNVAKRLISETAPPKGPSPHI